MRRVWGYVLVGLAAFLLALAPLCKWYVAPRIQVAPLGCTDTSVICKDRVNLSPSAGTATTLFDPATLTSNANVPLVGMERVRADVTASTGADNRTVYDESQTVSRADGTLVVADTMRIPFNGTTSDMIDCCHGNVDGTPIADYSGINPLKFGFDTQKQTYLYFDRTINKATQMNFKDVETIDGVQVYKFVQTIPPTRIGTLEVPGNLIGSVAASVDAPEYYANVRTVWVEPVTGVIVKGSEQQLQTLRDVDGNDKVTLIAATLTFTPANVKASADAASSAASQIGLITTTIPIVGLVLGLVLLALGLWLILGASDARRQHAAPAAQPATAEPTEA
jgi:Porin PorA